jgi:suppressor of G2 allele of SKP1
MDAAARGKKALADGRYEEAVAAYTVALKSSPTSPDYLIQRATAYQRAKNYTSALADADNAVLYAQKRAKREAIVDAQFRRGCALYSLERYGDAEFVFEVVKRMDEKHKSVTAFMGRNQQSMNKLDPDDVKRKCTVKETPDLDVGVTDVASPTCNAGTASTAPGAPQAPAPPQQTPPDKIRHEWYQNSEHIYFTLLAKGVPEDKAQIDIQERSISISFPLITGSSYDLTLEPLFASLKPEKCIIRVLPAKIELVLAKAISGQKWSTLESKEPINPPSATNGSGEADSSDAVRQAVLNDSKSAGPAYPTSSKSGPKDWDKVVADARRADSTGKGGAADDDDYEGGDEANHFFKKLFKDASPDVQKAMMKSYTESNGTALSTNWDEVSKGKVETVPPDGMEAKNWEK